MRKTTKNSAVNSSVKNLITECVGVLLAVLFFVVIPGIVGVIETRYTMISTVVEVEENIIVVEDTTGNVWSFEGDNFRTGDEVVVTFFTNHTDNTRQDDEIKKVEKKQKKL